MEAEGHNPCVTPAHATKQESVPGFSSISKSREARGSMEIPQPCLLLPKARDLTANVSAQDFLWEDRGLCCVGA